MTYDSGEGKIEQSKKLKELLEKEYQKGNYVLEGGDFNQVFKPSKRFTDTRQEGWHPGEISTKDLPNHFDFVFDDTVPTVRVLNKPYQGNYEESQVYVIDGFVVSDNLQVMNVTTTDLDFENSDHHPVSLSVELK